MAKQTNFVVALLLVAVSCSHALTYSGPVRALACTGNICCVQFVPDTKYYPSSSKGPNVPAPCNTNSQACWDITTSPQYLPLAIFAASGGSIGPVGLPWIGFITSGACSLQPDSEDLLHMSTSSHKVHSSQILSHRFSGNIFTCPANLQT